MELEKIRMAVSMTAQCKSVDWNGQEWTAVLWANAIGDYVAGTGPDEWAAVQAAHAEKHKVTRSQP